MDLQESNSLPSPKLEGNDRMQARALAILYSHPVVSLDMQIIFPSVMVRI